MEQYNCRLDITWMAWRKSTTRIFSWEHATFIVSRCRYYAIYSSYWNKIEIHTYSWNYRTD